MHDAEGPSHPEVYQSPNSLQQLAAETCALLNEASVDIAIAEAGTGGEIARLLRPSGDSRAALTEERIYATPEALALGLRVSPAKVEAFGALSAMVAAEAAAELIDTYEGGWGVVAMVGKGNASPETSVESEGASLPDGFVAAGNAGGDAFVVGAVVAVGTPSLTIVRQCPAGEVARTTIELLGEQAWRRLKNVETRPA